MLERRNNTSLLGVLFLDPKYSIECKDINKHFKKPNFTYSKL